MSGLKPLHHKVLIKKLRAFGFERPFSGGKHLFMSKVDLDLTLPNPRHSDIGVDLLKRILNQAKISREKWLENS